MHLKIAIFHIVADEAVVKARTRRVIDDNTPDSENTVISNTPNAFLSDEEIEEALHRIPKAVSVLKPFVDYCCVIHNKVNNEPVIVKNSKEINQNS